MVLVAHEKHGNIWQQTGLSVLPEVLVVAVVFGAVRAATQCYVQDLSRDGDFVHTAAK